MAQFFTTPPKWESWKKLSAASVGLAEVDLWTFGESTSGKRLFLSFSLSVWNSAFKISKIYVFKFRQVPSNGIAGSRNIVYKAQENQWWKNQCFPMKRYCHSYSNFHELFPDQSEAASIKARCSDGQHFSRQGDF